MTMTMVTARVDADRKRDAEQVLRRNGRTYSDVIRDLTDYMARTGELPEFEKATLALIEERERQRKLDIIRFFADMHLPEPQDGLSDEEIIEQTRMERFG
ncbi:type II toxin-antitoxin system RelB/DinJ family antitoxin [Bifidobacterium leontopitheci]|uniref:RelB antitoxin n=1 Tax=Bifidobacterium leontopitheci TaxID=2650774 RepID=A0A6I1GG89_9BIFI|nr:type II toxin-antitoxin system RelB/DinJ family antitoxin [Bifidobacterium leontopitheci]KAB7789702.1 RelB antitoxin [Bifidobacterium leontopitheci]